MTGYHWDNEDTAALLAQADTIELGALVDDGDAVDRTDDYDSADFFSLYAHIAGQGVDCIADRPTLDEARQLAAQLAAQTGLPVREY